MNQAEQLAFARDELERSKNWRGQGASGLSFDDAWKRYIDLYKGLHYDARSGTDRLVVNLIFSTINVMAPAVAINNPRFVVNARKPDSANQAIIVEEVLNYLWRRNDYQREVRLAVLDFLIAGHGWLKVGYKAVKKPETKPADEAPQRNAAGSTADGSDEGVDDREDVEGNTESEMHVDDDRPFVERISIFDVFVDPDARHPKEMRWISQRTWRAVQDVHVDERYSATQRKRVSGSRWDRWGQEEGDGRSGSNASDVSSDRPDSGAISYAEIIEFYDLKRGTVGTFAVGSEGDADDDKESGWLIKPKEIPYATGHPFVMLRNYEVPDHFYPMGDVVQIESLQAELNETRTQMLNYRKKYRRAYAYAKDRLDEEAVEALQSDEDNVAIGVLGDSNPGDAIVPVQVTGTPPEFFDQSAMIQDDLNQVSGVSDYARGNPQQFIKRTATEAAMIQDSANARAQDRLMKVEDVLAEAGSRVIQLMQQYMTNEQVIRIVTLPIQGWLQIDKDYLEGEFDFEVRGGSTEPQNETFRRQSALQMMDAMIPFMESGIVNMPALAMKVLRDGFGEKDAQKYITAAPMEEPVPPEEMVPPEAMNGGPPAPQGGMPMGPPPMPAGPAPTPETGGGIPPELLALVASMGGEMPQSMGAAGGAQLSPEDMALLMALERGAGGAMPPPEMMMPPPMGM